MTLKQLEAFYWAATYPNFVSAAEQVHLSVSSLSKRISELEIDLGKALFDRAGHRAVLTDAGQLLLPRAKALLAHAEEIRTEVINDSNLRGVCRFGVGEISSLTWLPSFIRAVRQRYPELKLEPSVDAGSSLGILEQKVSDGLLDFAIVAGRPSRSTVHSEQVGEVNFSWVGSKNLVGSEDQVSARLLTQFPVISSALGTGSTRVLNDWLDISNVTVNQRLSCNSWAAVAGLLSEGMGIGILPTSWAVRMTQLGDLRLLNCVHALPPLRYSIHWRSEDKRPLIVSMRDTVKECIDFDVPVRWLGGEMAHFSHNRV